MDKYFEDKESINIIKGINLVDKPRDIIKDSIIRSLSGYDTSQSLLYALSSKFSYKIENHKDSLIKYSSGLSKAYLSDTYLDMSLLMSDMKEHAKGRLYIQYLQAIGISEENYIEYTDNAITIYYQIMDILKVLSITPSGSEYDSLLAQELALQSQYEPYAYMSPKAIMTHGNIFTDRWYDEIELYNWFTSKLISTDIKITSILFQPVDPVFFVMKYTIEKYGLLITTGLNRNDFHNIWTTKDYWKPTIQYVSHKVTGNKVNITYNYPRTYLLSNFTVADRPITIGLNQEVLSIDSSKDTIIVKTTTNKYYVERPKAIGRDYVYESYSINGTLVTLYFQDILSNPYNEVINIPKDYKFYSKDISTDGKYSVTFRKQYKKYYTRKLTIPDGYVYKSHEVLDNKVIISFLNQEKIIVTLPVDSTFISINDFIKYSVNKYKYVTKEFTIPTGKQLCRFLENDNSKYVIAYTNTVAATESFTEEITLPSLLEHHITYRFNTAHNYPTDYLCAITEESQYLVNKLNTPEVLIDKVFHPLIKLKDNVSDEWLRQLFINQTSLQKEFSNLNNSYDIYFQQGISLDTKISSSCKYLFDLFELLGSKSSLSKVKFNAQKNYPYLLENSFRIDNTFIKYNYIELESVEGKWNTQSYLGYSEIKVISKPRTIINIEGNNNFYVENNPDYAYEFNYRPKELSYENSILEIYLQTSEDTYTKISVHGLRIELLIDNDIYKSTLNDDLANCIIPLWEFNIKDKDAYFYKGDSLYLPRDIEMMYQDSLHLIVLNKNTKPVTVVKEVDSLEAVDESIDLTELDNTEFVDSISVSPAIASYHNVPYKEELTKSEDFKIQSQNRVSNIMSIKSQYNKSTFLYEERSTNNTVIGGLNQETIIDVSINI